MKTVMSRRRIFQKAKPASFALTGLPERGGDLAIKSLKLSKGLFGHHLLVSSGNHSLMAYLPPQPTTLST
jgi:hypothetical protein